MDRRGLAYDQASVLSWGVHSRWIATLIQHKHRAPPPDYRAVSWQQLHTADCELFMLAAQEARSGVRPDARGTKPLDALVTSLMTDSRVTFFLMPMPKGGPQSAPAAVQDSPSVAHVPRQQQQQQQQQRGAKRQLPQQVQQQQHQQQPKKANKGKGKGKKQPMARANKKVIGPDGNMSHTRSGKPLCAAYNGAGCQRGTNVGGLQECPQGVHLCNAPSCKARATHGRAAHNASHE